jgi:mono/diheme cytochrome c family protein
MSMNRFVGYTLAGFLLLAGTGASLLAQEKGIKKVSMPYSDPTSGAQMYKDYCAACHGAKGMGNGPAVEFLKAAPPDLRTLAQRNAGTFPARHVAGMLKFGTASHAHGTSDMPLWGPVFRARDTDENIASLRIHNLTAFIESLQQK